MNRGGIKFPKKNNPVPKNITAPQQVPRWSDLFPGLRRIAVFACLGRLSSRRDGRLSGREEMSLALLRALRWARRSALPLPLSFATFGGFLIFFSVSRGNLAPRFMVLFTDYTKSGLLRLVRFLLCIIFCSFLARALSARPWGSSLPDGDLGFALFSFP